jgi:hypothetical protein
MNQPEPLPSDVAHSDSAIPDSSSPASYPTSSGFDSINEVKRTNHAVTQPQPEGDSVKLDTSAMLDSFLRPGQSVLLL